MTLPSRQRVVDELKDAGLQDTSIRWTIMPLLLLAAVVDLLSAAAACRIPLKQIGAPLLWILISACCVLLLRAVSKSIPWRVLVATALCGVIVLGGIRHYWKSCAFSDSVIPTADAWSYAAFGKYLWENSRGVDAGLSISDEYASHLKGSRFAASGLLSFLSLLSRAGDSSSAMMIFILVCFLGVFGSLFYLCRQLGFSEACSFAGGAFGVSNGWVRNAVLVGNLDNLLFLPLFTTFVGAAIGAARSERGVRGYSIPLALSGSASLYCYPEGFIVGCFLASPIAAWTLFNVAARQQIRRALLAVLATVALAIPYLGIAYAFLHSQFAITHQSIRPGEGYFPGLWRASSLLPAVYAMGEEFPRSTGDWWNWVLPAALAILMLIGLWRLRHAAPMFALCAVPFGILSAWQSLGRYDYGLFKILLNASFFLTPVLTCGIHVAASRVKYRPSTCLALAAVAIILTAMWEREEDHATEPWNGVACVAELRDLAALRFLFPNKAIAVDIADPSSQSWAMYYMRDVNAILTSPAGYLAMSHITPFLSRARSVASLPVAGRLREGTDGDALWTNGSFSVVAAAERPQVLMMRNPNGVERIDRAPFVWVGPEPLVLTVLTPARGAYWLSAVFIPGPSAPEKPSRSLKVDAGGRSFTIDVASDTRGFSVNLEKGESTILLSCLDQPTVRRMPNGDTRPLLLGMHHVALQPAGVPDQ